MSRVYESLLNTMNCQDDARNSPAPVRPTELNLSEATNAFQTVVTDLLSAIKAVSNEIESLGAEQRRQHDTITHLKEKITALQIRIGAAEKATQKEDPAVHSPEEQIVSEIDALDYAIRQRAELPETRVVVNNLQSEIAPRAASRRESEASDPDKGWQRRISSAGMYSVTGSDRQHNKDGHSIATRFSDTQSGDDRDLSATTADSDLEKGKRYVSQLSFQRLTGELVELIGPIAPLVIHDHIARLGESIQKFPEDRVAELVELVVSEFEREVTRAHFREVMGKLL